MTALGTIVIDRSGLSLADLTIDTEGFGTYLVDVAGLGRPGVVPRETFAATSPWVSGQLRTSVTLEETTLPLVVRVQAASSSALDTAVTALEAALNQFVYTVTKTVDGVAKAYTAYPATIGAVDGLTTFAGVQAHFEDLSISIPIYPTPVP